MADQSSELPRGQFELDHHPRYGLWQYAHHYRKLPIPLHVEITGDLQNPLVLDESLMRRLPRVEQTNDIHCVTTWSWCGLTWSGVRLKDLYEQIVVPEGKPTAEIRYVILRSLDNYRTFSLLEDALAEDVLLADHLNHAAVDWDHGAPLRFVAPAHYAFKSAKHVCGIEFRGDLKGYHSPALHWTEHPRGRVAFEERGVLLPGWLYRYLFHPAVRTVIWTFRRAAKKRKD